MRISTTSLLFSLFISLSIFSAYTLKGIDVENPVVDFTSPPVVDSARGSKDALLCERIRVSGISRLNLGSYASVYRVTLAPSVVIPERLYSKIQICFHKNASLGLCQCEKDDWKAVYKGLWNSVMSPYEDRYLDVKFVGEVSGSVTVTVEEEFQQWRVFCLALGFVLQLMAPIVSSWVPFYYSSSMAIGVFLVIIIILFQGMKLLPTGRKNIFYLTVYGSVLGAGSFLLHQFSLLINSILLNFGLSEEMHNPVSVLVLVLIILAGAALGYWLVRKFVISEDGTVDVGIAQFVKWAMRIIGFTFMFQSSLDTPLALSAQGCCLVIWFSFTYLKWHSLEHMSYPGNGSPWALSTGRTTTKHTHAEFLSRSGKKSPRGTLWKSPRTSSAWTDSPVKGLVSPPSIGTRRQQDFYSTFHKTPNRKKFSKKQWENFTEESTRQALAEWASSPDFTDWIVKNADRVKVLPDESSDETIGSGSDSTDDIAVESSNGLGFFRWQRRK